MPSCRGSSPRAPGPSGTECCPVNWLEFEGSCYWFSRSGETWPEAEKHCRLENAHLVVVNSREEQVSAAQGMPGGAGQAALVLFSNQRKRPEAEVWPSAGKFMAKRPLILRGGTLAPGARAQVLRRRSVDAGALLAGLGVGSVMG